MPHAGCRRLIVGSQCVVSWLTIAHTGSNGLHSVARLVHALPDLQELNLSENNLGAKHARMLVPAIRHSTSLRTVQLCDVPLPVMQLKGRMKREEQEWLVDNV